MKWLEQKGTPLLTHSAAVYPYDSKVEKRFSLISNYEDPFSLSKRVGNYLWLPRELCPMGKDQRVVGPSVDFALNFTPRSEDQSRVVDESSNLLLNGDSHILQAGTGFGKTYVGSAIIGQVGRKALIIVTKADVKHHWIKALQEVLNLPKSRIGLIQADTVDVAGKDVVVAMVQSVCKDGRYPSWVYREFGLIVIDEVQRMGADKFSQAMWQFPGKLRFGLTAQPKRKDGKDVVFHSHIGPVRVKATTPSLVPKIIYFYTGVMFPPDMKVTPGRTMHIDKMLAAMPKRNLCLAHAMLSAHAKGRNPVLFSSTKKHLQNIHDLLVSRGVKSKDIGLYVGGLTEKQQDIAKARPFVLCTYAMASEATDAPWWDVLILGTPRSDVLQIVGRVRREYEGKCHVHEETKEGLDRAPVVIDPVDDSLWLLQKYFDKRRQWYYSIGSKIIRVPQEVMLHG